MTDALRETLTTNGYDVELKQLPEGPAVVGRRKDFRVRWMLTQLKTSVVVETAHHVSADSWKTFLQEAFAVARGFRGGLPNGLQSGVGMVAVLVCESADADAVALAELPAPKEWFTGIGVSALVVRGSGAVHQHEGRVLVGRAYVPFLRSQRDLVVRAVQ